MAAGDDAPKPITLFYSYSHRDEELRVKLQEHLAALRRAGLISEWHDRNIDAGDEWAKEIDRNLSTADIILLLVSPSFINSDYCWSVEVKKALERHDRGEAVVVPVMLRPCRFGITPFAKLQALPKDAQAVTEWSNQDTAFDNVAAKIETLVGRIRDKRAATARPHPLPLPGGEGGARVSGRVRAFKDLEVFRDVDAPWCPEMVVIPAGEFTMGSPPGEAERSDVEGPQHTVTIRYQFALGRYPVTVREYRTFVEATGHRHEGGMYAWTGSEWKQDPTKSYQDPGFAQTDRSPVVGVDWRDAVAYCEWLEKVIGQPYRLPSEAEWEYACRAGTTRLYSWGDAITPEKANYSESKLYKTTEVGAYPANPWGLFDLHGNVREWVEDVWHGNYQGAPVDGSAWTEGERKDSPRIRVNRGGSRDGNPRDVRSASRYGDHPGDRSSVLGFRVARTLD